MKSDPIEIDKKAHNKLFYFSMGFFSVPFTLFIAQTTVDLIRNPEAINNELVILYIAILAGLYHTARGKDGYLKISKKENPKEYQWTATLGLLAFIYCLLFINSVLEFTNTNLNIFNAFLKTLK